MVPMRVTKTAVQALGPCASACFGDWELYQYCVLYSRANQPSSSSRRLGAGRGAPGFAWVGSLTLPDWPNGFSDCSLERMGVDMLVLTGMSGSRRDQPMELMESRKELEAMLGWGKYRLAAGSRSETL